VAPELLKGEPVTDDRRTAFEHDSDRILYSDAFRRLGGVTQVVAVGETPLFHTRLTHTLKVAQLSHRMAEHLARDPENSSLIAGIGGLEPSAAEAAGLAHDLGHPPFGHIGEAALNTSCVEYGLDGFEGNAQTFRIIAKLARRGDPDRYGLKLDKRTLRATLKYPWLREGVHQESKKWNAYPTEREDFNRAREGYDHEGQSIEAAIMDWADDITYAVHDMEDFFRAGRIPLARLIEDQIEMATFTASAAQRLSSKPNFDPGEASAAFAEILRLTFTNARHYRGTESNLLALQRASRVLINRYVSAIRLQRGRRPLHVPDGIRYEVEMFKQLTWHYIIDDPALATSQQGQDRIIESLFIRLMEWLDHEEEASRAYRLPTRLRDLYNLTKHEPGSEYYTSVKAQRARAIADYISSLTEKQAIDLHERLSGTAQHSILDPWLAY
jgi:dGTPase